ncbi:MAG: TolC family protein [Gemmatimonadota bacterium]|nr:TolC family protein [Gemmatimonadota bacterium]
MHRAHLLGILLSVVSGLIPMVGWAQEPTGGAPTTDTVTLTLQDAERLALERNLLLGVARREEDIALGERRQAGVYRFNPEVEFEAERLDVPGGQSPLDRYEAVVTQELEWAGQWGLRKDAANHDLRQARASVQNAERRTLLDVREAFHEAAAAQRKVAVAEEMAELNERLRNAVTTQRAEGEGERTRGQSGPDRAWPGAEPGADGSTGADIGVSLLEAGLGAGSRGHASRWSWPTRAARHIRSRYPRFPTPEGWRRTR